MITTNTALTAEPASADGRLGLRVERYFTTSGIHPYEQVEWELRDAVINDWKSGKVAFEQRGVEFPKAWSQNATMIVAQKYFRGHLGAPDREHSVRQIIDRVADTITDWGAKDGYFVDRESAEVFNAELKHLLVHQKAAFNSPVWFNLGVPGRKPQGSACFILSVEDTMSSILNWYVEEGTIFKGGSGSGVNLSSIRSSYEPLTGGGTASGPVSFMRGADASAGTIKSGGTTRRAAKMVILNVDHPDIEEFIWCKQREELKARALSAAGFDMDLDGRDSSSIQYQNANNSVRVTDEFMQAVLANKDFALRSVRRGEPVKVLPARDLIRQIAQSAWECADPGMQYDTTINDWHTTPNAGRINGSNPCSEYMHLDNSACNLASLNLRKFEAGGVFDVDAFRRAVEIVFTAQEIIVSNSSYPTEKIAANANAYRQLGLGYANLGGLLMSQGLAYDSDEGRAWASTITALMTGHAYRTSAEIARVVGPFDGYAKDRDGMLRVLRKHRAALDAVDTAHAPAHLLAAARQAWDEAVALGTEHGVRNAQASVLAPTGCLVGGSLVTTDRGLVRLASLGEEAGARWQDLDARVATDEGPRSATKFYVNGLEAVVSVETSRGYRIQGTPAHRIKVMASGGGSEWRRLADLRPRDVVPLLADQLVGEPRLVELAPPGTCVHPGVHESVPRRVTPDLAQFVGYLLGGARLHEGGFTWLVDEGDFQVAEHVRLLGKALFGLEAQISERQGSTEVAFDSACVAGWLRAHGADPRAPRIPDMVLASNNRAVYAAFLNGLLEVGATVHEGRSRWCSLSVSFSHDVQSMLLALGYPSTLEFDSVHWLVLDAVRIESTHDDAGASFLYDTVETVELGEDELTYDLSVPENVTYVANGFVSHNTIGLMMDCDTTGIEPDLGLVKSKKLVGGGTMRIVNQTVPAALERLGYQPEQIEAIVEYIDQQATIEGAPAFRPEHLPVFDCAMGERCILPMGHVKMMAAVQPWISGAISKTINLPESATVEDVEQVYVEGWRMGLKALAIYRDNCKVGQPLSLAPKKETQNTTEQAAAASGMVRRRLPKQRPSQTISFQVGDAEGYLTAGEYPGDGLGEIFVKLGKQGSTLAGVMDAFAISVSIGLQYGVPLEVYVRKFTNMRFEPAGMTDDPEVRFATSIVDYLFRRLAIEYLPSAKRHELGIYTIDERTVLEAGSPMPSAPPIPLTDATGQTVLPIERPTPVDDTHGDAPMCYQCGVVMIRAGSCHCCPQCGSTSGCS